MSNCHLHTLGWYIGIVYKRKRPFFAYAHFLSWETMRLKTPRFHSAKIVEK